MKSLLLVLSISISLISISQRSRQSYHDMLKTYYKNTIPTISPSDLYIKILKGGSIYLLDTREEKEYSVSKIKGAIHVGYNDFNIKSTDILKRDVTVIVYCTIGARSENIGEKLKKEGFTDVYNLYGGLIYWVNQGYPVVDNSNQTTQNIHIYSQEWGKWLKKGKPIH